VDAVTTPLTSAAGPVGLAAGLMLEVGKSAIQKAIRADWTQTKEREFKKADA
jgi:hypothetical protein